MVTDDRPLSATVMPEFLTYMNLVGIDAAGSMALRLLVIEPKVRSRVPVAAAILSAANVNETCVFDGAIVPEPDVIEPDEAETAYSVPAAIDEFVVAVMLEAVRTTKAGCEKLTVVGNL